MKPTSVLVLTMLSFVAVTADAANVVGYDETFALAEHRADALRELIAGTEDYYYYHGLYHQQRGEFDAARRFLDEGIAKFKHTPRLRELENRQALLTYTLTPDATIAYLVDRLNPDFRHRRKQLKPELALPTTLSATQIDSERLMNAELRREHRHVNAFEPAAFDWLVRQQLTPEQRRAFLQRLERPDYPGLVALIDADLRHPHSRGFGAMPVHRALLIPQLETLLKSLPGLINETPFIHAYLSKLQPAEGVNRRQDDAEALAYLERIEAFINRLPPSQNSLKAHVLFQRLLFDQRHDRYDRERFMAYLRLPRPVHYINSRYVRRSQFRGLQVNLNADFKAVTLLPPIGIDEPLVRDYLMHFLKTAPDYKAFADYIESAYLKHCFAEVKLVNGIGDQAQWYAMLPPETVRSLRDRVDLELLPTNPLLLSAAAPVTLDVGVKNVTELWIKVYEIHAAAYYRRFGKPVASDIDLDGMVPNHERRLAFAQPPMLRHVERLAVPEATQPGLYVVELIGNGMSSRALVQKGQLRFRERRTAAGHALTVFDATGSRLPDATVWTGGKTYTANDKGEILVPYAGGQRSAKLVLEHGRLASLWDWTQASEQYDLAAGIHIERESLVEGETCRILVRPRLSIASTAADIGLLETPVLTIRSLDQDGTAAEKRVAPFELANNRESIHELRVPQRLRTLTVTLSGKVRNLNSGELEDLSDSAAVTVNGITATEKLENIFLRRTEAGYRLELRGRNGEPMADKPLYLSLQNRFVGSPVTLALKTNADGITDLGLLQDIVSLTARGSEQTTQTWTFDADQATTPGTLILAVGEPALIPFMGDGRTVKDAFSLLEIRGGTPVRDGIDKLAYHQGYLVITGLEPGDYQLTDRLRGGAYTLRVGQPLEQPADGKPPRLNRPPLQITDTTVQNAELVVTLKAATPDTRVHIVATRYQWEPATPLIRPLPFATPTIWRGDKPETLYLSGRRMGDEYRYIMERRAGRIRPGNMLNRPSLILNPWSLGETTAGRDDARAGEAWESIAASRSPGARGRALLAYGGMGSTAGTFPSVDFLANASRVIDNLTPDAQGLVRVPLKALGAGRHVHVHALNAHSGVYRQTALPVVDDPPRERRLVRPLDPASHVTQRKQISILRKGELFRVHDLLSAELEVYDSLARAHALLNALSNEPLLETFSFILDWPELDEAARLEQYSKHACHELNYFLMRKDPAFFAKVIRPYLANKLHPTFLDDFLLGRVDSGRLAPWRYARLNAVERILLAQALPDERAATGRHIGDRYDLIPPNPEQYDARFQAALRSRGLDTGDSVAGMAAAKADYKAEEERLGTGLGALRMTGLSGARARRQEASALDAVDMVKSPAPASAPKPAAEVMPKPPAEQEPRELMDDFIAMDGGVAFAEDPFGSLEQDKADRAEVRQLFRKLGATEEWVENHYYHVPMAQQVADLVDANLFWKDYAARDGKAGFLSAGLIEAAGNFTEMMFVLGSLELPFRAAEHKTVYADGGLSLTPGNDVIIVHKQLAPASDVAERQELLLRQNYFALNDRYRHEHNERFDKFVTEAFEVGRVYGCQVVLTNPTSARRKLELLTQIPPGAIAVKGDPTTHTRHIVMAPYSTQTFEYHFYFPAPGEFTQFPVHASEQDTVMAFAEPFTFRVVPEVTDIDETSWEHISQFATHARVLAYLSEHNIDRLELDLIAFRMREADFFRRATALLRQRHVYHHTLWAYALYHKDRPTLREYLAYSPIATRCGRVLDSPLLTLNPVERHVYEHREYWPLVNPRSHRLGGRHKILNHALFSQYMSFLENLRYRPALRDEDRLSLVVYLLYQDRIEEALTAFDHIDPKRLDAQVPFDYMRAYLAFYREAPAQARAVAERYADYPVARWRKAFAEIIAQCDEIAGGTGAAADPEDRTRTQTQLADTEPQLALTIEAGRLRMQHANIDRVTLNFYPMDIEFLFSRRPFVQDVGNQFALLRPNATLDVALPPDRDRTETALPEAFRGRNVMVEATAAGISRHVPYYPNSLRLDVIERYGQIKVSHQETGQVLSKVYIKVYARMADGRAIFYKDGYTDLRGRFDYASLNRDDIGGVMRFAILVLSDDLGAMVEEASPPPM